jgi:hypothetical protein
VNVENSCWTPPEPERVAPGKSSGPRSAIAERPHVQLGNFQIIDGYGRLLIERYDRKLRLQLAFNEGSGGVVNSSRSVDVYDLHKTRARDIISANSDQFVVVVPQRQYVSISSRREALSTTRACLTFERNTFDYDGCLCTFRTAST